MKYFKNLALATALAALGLSGTSIAKETPKVQTQSLEESLFTLEDAEGSPVFNKYDTTVYIDEFRKSGGTFEYARDLVKAALEKEQVIDGKSYHLAPTLGEIAEWRAESLTVSEFRRIFAKAGNWDSMDDYLRFKREAHGTIDDFFKFANFANDYNFQRQYPSIRKLHITSDELQDLRSHGLEDFYGDMFQNYLAFREHGGTHKKFLQLSEITVNHGIAGIDIEKKRIVDDSLNFECYFLFKKMGGTDEQLKQINELGIDFGGYVINFRQNDGGTHNEAIRLHELGLPLRKIPDVSMAHYIDVRSRKGRDGVPYIGKEDTDVSRSDLRFVEKLSKMVDEHGRPLFNGGVYYARKNMGFTPDYLKELVTFRDTEKPNAVIVLPTRDVPFSPEFQNTKVADLLKRVRESYDVAFTFASNENDVYELLDRTPNIELLVLAGPGDGHHLCLGRLKNNFMDIGKLEELDLTQDDERYTIDTDDIEIQEHLKNLNPNATVLLASCFSARQDRPDQQNLADFVANMTRGRTVIAPKTFVGIRNLVIDSMYPLQARFVKEKEGDVTYTTKR